jgi:DNA-binding XRE family transcriptional regulator
MSWTLKQYKYVVEHLELIRESYKLTIEQLAKKLKTNKNLVLLWEVGGCEPSLKKLLMLEAVLNSMEYKPPNIDKSAWTMQVALEMKKDVVKNRRGEITRLCRMLDISRDTLYNWKRGRGTSLSSLVALEEYYQKYEPNLNYDSTAWDISAAHNLMSFFSVHFVKLPEAAQSEALRLCKAPANNPNSFLWSDVPLEIVLELLMLFEANGVAMARCPEHWSLNDIIEGQDDVVAFLANRGITLQDVSFYLSPAIANRLHNRTRKLNINNAYHLSTVALQRRANNPPPVAIPVIPAVPR